MKLTIFSQHFWPENFRINDLAFHLKKYFHVNIFTGQPNYPTGIIKKKYRSLIPISKKTDGIEITRFPIVERGQASKFKLILNYISYIFSVTFFSFFFKKKFGDIFFIYGTSPIFQAIPAIIIGKIFNVPIVLWVQDMWPGVLKDTRVIKNSILLSLVGKVVNIIYNNCDLILCQSEAFYNYIKKKTKSKIKVFHNPSNYKFVNNKKLKKKYFDILYTGNLGIAHDFENIFDVFNSKEILNNRIRLKIYGSGKNFKYYKKKIKEKNDKNIFIYKAVSPKKLSKILNSADSFFLTLNNGIGLSKTIPAKFQTYVSYGKPIICVNKGIVSKYVEMYNVGFACDLKKVNVFKEIIIKTKKLSNQKLKEISSNSKKLFYEKFEINNSCKKLKMYLESLI